MSILIIFNYVIDYVSYDRRKSRAQGESLGKFSTSPWEGQIYMKNILLASAAIALLSSNAFAEGRRGPPSPSFAASSGATFSTEITAQTIGFGSTMTMAGGATEQWTNVNLPGPVGAGASESSGAFGGGIAFGPASGVQVTGTSVGASFATLSAFGNR